jgi:hypothetical protein
MEDREFRRIGPHGLEIGLDFGRHIGILGGIILTLDDVVAFG